MQMVCVDVSRQSGWGVGGFFPSKFVLQEEVMEGGGGRSHLETLEIGGSKRQRKDLDEMRQQTHSALRRSIFPANQLCTTEII